MKDPAHGFYDWDDAYQNAAYIEGSDAYPECWLDAAERFRRQHPGKQDIPYGPTRRQTLDLFEPEGPPKGLMLYLHGGYWQRFDKTVWSHLATGALAHGYAVAIPSYTLAPAARICEMASEVAWALATAASRIEGPVHLVGHSAGGQLATRLVTKTAPLDPDTGQRIHSVLSISGLHDLTPLINTHMNEILQVSDKEARYESPALLEPRPGVRVTVWVGADERPEFLRQAKLLSEAWDVPAIFEDRKNHFNVVDALADPDSPITRAALAFGA